MAERAAKQGGEETPLCPAIAPAAIGFALSKNYQFNFEWPTEVRSESMTLAVVRSKRIITRGNFLQVMTIESALFAGPVDTRD